MGLIQGKNAVEELGQEIDQHTDLDKQIGAECAKETQGPPVGVLWKFKERDDRPGIILVTWLRFKLGKVQAVFLHKKSKTDEVAAFIREPSEIKSINGKSFEMELFAFADDTDIIARTPTALRQVFLPLEALRMGLKINENKTKYMPCPKSCFNNSHFKIEEYSFKVVDTASPI
ncbi:reverse transcriptase domain-containing protein [Trichonephila clavipes]|nr:reverse transcriptase domain-containing protein [Trichonephila clavipes]